MSQHNHILKKDGRIRSPIRNGTVRRRPFFASIGIILLLLFMYIFHRPNLPTKTSLKPSYISRTALGEIPARIWQVYWNFGNTEIGSFTAHILSWITTNQDYAYVLMSEEGADAFARVHYSDRPEILQPFLDLRFPIARTDLLRYMILESKGGVYSDLDTIARKPISQWIPAGLVGEVHAIVGIEYDQLDDELWPGLYERLQFCQWTMAASPGHPIVKRAVQDVVRSLHSVAEKQNTTIAGINLEDDEVLKQSGPVIWTKAVMQTISEATGSAVDYGNFTGMKEAQLFGDILVLPIDAFGSGQEHSNARLDGGDDVYVRHTFRGSWRHGATWSTEYILENDNVRRVCP